jgi:hypothetical protein
MVVKAVYVFLRLIRGTGATIMYADRALTILAQPSNLLNNANEALTLFYKDVGGQLSLPNLVLFYILFSLATNQIVQRVMTTSSVITINMADFLLARIANAMFSNLFSEASMRTIEGTGMQRSNSSDIDRDISTDISTLVSVGRYPSFSSRSSSSRSSSDSSISGDFASKGVEKIITNFFEHYNEVNSGSQEVHEAVEEIKQTVVKSTAQNFFSFVEKFINPGLSEYSSSQDSIERQHSQESIESIDGIEKVDDVSDLLNPKKTNIIEEKLSEEYLKEKNLSGKVIPVELSRAVEEIEQTVKLSRAVEFPGIHELQQIARINLDPNDEGLNHPFEELHTGKKMRIWPNGNMDTDFGGKKTTKRRKHKKNKTKDIKKRYTAAKKRKNRNKRYSKKK